jgi:hypothetical protein
VRKNEWNHIAVMRIKANRDNWISIKMKKKCFQYHSESSQLTSAVHSSTSFHFLSLSLSLSLLMFFSLNCLRRFVYDWQANCATWTSTTFGKNATHPLRRQ